MAYFKVLSRRIYGRNTTRLRHDNAGNSAPYPTAYRKRAKASKRFGINPKTVAKWCKRTSTERAVRGPRPASTVLTPAEEAAIVLFRQQPLLPLDNWLCALQEAIPQLSRSALHHCFQCHGISCLSPSEELGETQKKKFKRYPIGNLHVDFAEVQTEEGKPYLFLAIDRTSEWAFAELHHQATQVIAVRKSRLRYLARLGRNRRAGLWV